MTYKMTQTISINGETQMYSAQTVYDLLLAHQIDPKRPGIAIALNDSILSRDAWESTMLQPDDRVEIVYALSGG